MTGNTVAQNEILHPFVTDLAYQCESGGSTGDPRIAAYARAALRSLQINPVFRDSITELLHQKPDISPFHATSLVLRALQKRLMDLDKDYPYEYKEAGPWMAGIHVISDPSSKAYGDFMTDIMTRSLQSNIADRYKALDLIMNFYRYRLGDQPAILDVGCSQNHGLKKLALKNTYPFKDIMVTVNALYGSAPEAAIRLGDHHSSSKKLQKLFTNNISIGESEGVDIVPITPDSQQWTRSNSFYPSELLDEQKVEEFDQIDRAAPQNVSFHQADFAVIDEDQYIDSQWRERFNLIMFSTTLYQVRPHQRKRMLGNAMRYVKPDGLIVIQDFVNADGVKRNRLRFHKNSLKRPYIYTTIICDPQDENKTMQELFRWKNGRCRELRLLKGLGNASLECLFSETEAPDGGTASAP